jgi:putative hydrolase of the HAD superfamily
VFDLDDTLYPEMDYVISGFKTIASELEKKYHLTFLYLEFLEAFLCSNSNVFNYILDKRQIKYHKKYIAELVQVYRNHNPSISLNSNTITVLKYLIDNGFILALISDGYCYAQRKKIKALALNQYIKNIYLTDEFGRNFWKPSVFIFEKCKMDLGLPHSAFVYIGDNWNKDFLAGNQLGWLTIGIDNPSRIHRITDVPQEYKPAIVVSEINELISITEAGLI